MLVGRQPQVQVGPAGTPGASRPTVCLRSPVAPSPVARSPVDPRTEMPSQHGTLRSTRKS